MPCTVLQVKGDKKSLFGMFDKSKVKCDACPAGTQSAGGPLATTTCTPISCPPGSALDASGACVQVCDALHAGACYYQPQRPPACMDVVTDGCLAPISDWPQPW